MIRRKFLPWEKNWLRKHGWSEEKALLEGEKPVEYITGWADFLGRELMVTDKVLIPRIETERLVELIKKVDLIGGSGELNMAEVGVGNGAISLGLRWQMEELMNDGLKAHFWASDISREALEVARLNEALWFQGEEKMVFLESDLLLAYDPQIKFDVIVANLPYIPEGRKNELEESVRDFEPELALFGGIDGLEVIRRLLQQAPNHLTDGGRLWLEVDDTHDLQEVLSEFTRYTGQVYKDDFNKNRFWRLTL